MFTTWKTLENQTKEKKKKRKLGEKQLKALQSLECSYKDRIPEIMIEVENIKKSNYQYW